MKIKLELFGASRDFSNKDFLEFDIKQKIEIKDFRKEIINYLDKNFKDNESRIFCMFDCSSRINGGSNQDKYEARIILDNSTTGFCLKTMQLGTDTRYSNVILFPLSGAISGFRANKAYGFYIQARYNGADDQIFINEAEGWNCSVNEILN